MGIFGAIGGALKRGAGYEAEKVKSRFSGLKPGTRSLVPSGAGPSQSGGQRQPGGLIGAMFGRPKKKQQSADLNGGD